ncbi:MAG: hypothetical protein C4527_09620 [Candidatus Omnitrophota bacterium]|nr:MAG: hypothetical protein C4527_09620 [Candidatus Omnitrophota bacterium]
MMELTIKLWDTEYQRLEKISKKTGKNVETLIREWILQLAEAEESIDITRDPIYSMEGHGEEGPADLSVNADQYIYGGNTPE